MALSASAQDQQWAVVGAYSNPSWNFDASVVLSGTGDNLSCTIEKLTPDFKIVEISQNNWDTQYGTATPIEIGVPVTLDGKNGGPDPANMVFAGLIQAVNYAVVKWNPTTHVMVVEAEEEDVVVAYPTLYATGSFNEWAAPGTDTTPLCQFDDATHTYTVEVDLGAGNADGNPVEFKLAGEGWSNEIAGPEEDTIIGEEEATKVSRGGSNLKTYLTGMQTLTFNYDTMLMTFGSSDLVSGVNAVISEVEEAPVYYNLQGVKIANPDKGIYIVKKGNNVSKVVF